MKRFAWRITVSLAILAMAFLGSSIPAPAQGLDADETPVETPGPEADAPDSGADGAEQDPGAEPDAEEPQNPDTEDPAGPDAGLNPSPDAELPGGLEAETPSSDSENELESDADAVPLPSNSRVLAQVSSVAWTEQPNTRIAGADRYLTAVEVSKRTYPSGATTVLVATGLDFPDALSAAALGAKIKAPLLLTERSVLSSATRAEILRLKPSKIVVVGGPGIVSTGVESQLRSIVSNVSRVYGADRYETSAALARSGWTQASQAFVATGTDFADALAAAAAAGKLDAPVLLVPGTSSSVPNSVQKVLNDLKSTKVHIAGGTGAVSQSMQNALASGRSVVRYAGANRFDTSARIVNGVFSGPTGVYWANASGFADALTGAAAAGAQGAPLLLVEQSCVPTVVYQANDRVNSGQTFLLGGSGVLTDSVLIGNECMAASGVAAANRAGAQSLYTRLNLARYQNGLSAFRLADAAHGTPAHSWSASMVSGGAKVNPNLLTQQPWAVYQAVAQTSASGDKAARLGVLLLGNAQARSWLLKPSGGVRGSYSIGYAISGSTAYGTVIVGTNRK